MEYMQTKCLDETYDNYLIYCLDNSELFISSKLTKEIGSCVPVFSNSKTQLRKLYEKINAEPSPNFQKNDKKKRDRRFSRRQNNDYRVNLIYTPSSEQEITCQQIIYSVKDMLYQHIVKSIPAQPIFTNKEKKVFLIKKKKLLLLIKFS